MRFTNINNCFSKHSLLLFRFHSLQVYTLFCWKEFRSVNALFKFNNFCIPFPFHGCLFTSNAKKVVTTGSYNLIQHELRYYTQNTLMEFCNKMNLWTTFLRARNCIHSKDVYFYYNHDEIYLHGIQPFPKKKTDLISKIDIEKEIFFEILFKRKVCDNIWFNSLYRSLICLHFREIVWSLRKNKQLVSF